MEEYPGKEFDGTVTWHPQAQDAASRTMLVEVDLPNSDIKASLARLQRIAHIVPLELAGTPA